MSKNLKVLVRVGSCMKFQLFSGEIGKGNDELALLYY